MSALLRQEIRKSASSSLYKIAKNTGITRASLSRFVRGSQSLRLDIADRLAAHFGLVLRKR